MDYYEEWEFEECKILIDQFTFVLTSIAFPEQYNVFHNGEQCAYVRLRHGVLRCDVPVCGGESIYRFHFEDEIGAFHDDEEQMFHLKRIAAILGERMGLSEI